MDGVYRMVTNLSWLPQPDFMELPLSKDGEILVVYDEGSLGKKLVKKLKSKNFNVVTLQLPVYSLAELERSTVKSLLQMVETGQKSIDGVIYFHPKAEDKKLDIGSFAFPQEEQEKIEVMFLIAKHLASGFLKDQVSRDRFFTVVTQNDGHLGRTGNKIGSLDNAAYALTKTLNKEWSHVRCRAIDLDPSLTDANAIEKILDELHDPNRQIVEVAYNQDGRFAPGIIKQKPDHAVSEVWTLNHQDTVLVTGGAKGVTSDCIRELAKACHCNFILLGRTDISIPDPRWAVDCHSEQDLKKCILSNKLATTPKEADSIIKSLMARREIRSFIDEIQQYAAKIAYFSVDITQLENFKAVLRAVAGTLPPITAIIHGAGVLADNLIHRKTIAEWRKVFSTKITGLENVIKCVAADSLKNIVLFSSVASYYGNIGQSDYAMANAVLDASAYVLHRLYPKAKVISVNWGPWDGGMVSPNLKKMFQQQGIGLIPKKLGASMLYRELKSKQHDVQIIIGSEIP